MTDTTVTPFSGKIALVTGGAQGIGGAIALKFAELGADVVIADINLPHATETAERIAGLGRRSIAVETDVSSLGSVNALADRCASEMGRVDLLVNAAGLIRPGAFGEVTEPIWDLMFDVNSKGVFFCMQRMSADMNDGGSIVNISSIAGRGVLASSSPPYAASKAAVINLTRSAARALAPRRIRVNAICPGTIDTEFQTGLDRYIAERDGVPVGESLRQWATTVPLGRIGTAEDIARVAVFLSGRESEYITGQSINVDGGLVLS